MDWSRKEHLWALYFAIVSIGVFISSLGMVLLYLVEGSAWYSAAPSVLDWIIEVLAIPFAVLLFWAGYRLLTNQAGAYGTARLAIIAFLVLNALELARGISDLVTQGGFAAFSVALQVFNLLFWSLLLYLFRSRAEGPSTA